ncbi:MAG: glycosyltransferase family 2 protein [Flavobacteriaceae bacterium]
MNRIAVISMARNDDMFISKWIAYYGEHFGLNNLYLILDGLDQEKPDNQEINCIKVPHKQLTRSKGDKNRVQIVSKLAQSLFKRYDRVIACDIDEFLVLDPNTNTNLYDYLIQLKGGSSRSALGLDIGQHLDKESSIDLSQPFLGQRDYAVISSRYTKPVVALKPITWGSGYHRVKNKNFKIDPNLYLFHFGMVDFERSGGKTKDQSRLDQGWTQHLDRRFAIFKQITEAEHILNETFLGQARQIQNTKRPIYAWNKPGSLKEVSILKIPKRFKGIV